MIVAFLPFAFALLTVTFPGAVTFFTSGSGEAEGCSSGVTVGVAVGAAVGTAVGFGVGVAALVGCFFAGFWLLILTLGGAGYGLFTLLSNKGQRKQLEQKCADSIKSTSDTMQKLFVDFKQYQKELDEYDSYYERICDELNKI